MDSAASREFGERPSELREPSGPSDRDVGSDYLPTASHRRLIERAGMLRRVREYFDRHGFLEVETPLLSHDVVVDRHLDPLEVILPDDPVSPLEGPRLWLQTSPEFAMKRILAATRQSLFQITKAFRAGERGRWHNPEFTMVEWYEVGADYRAGMNRLSDLSQFLLDRGPAEIRTYREVFEEYVGVDPHVASPTVLRQIACDRELSVGMLQSDDRDFWLDALLTQLIQPRLGRTNPTILYDYPATQSALARLRPVGPIEVAERFELYVDGVELANGYHELLEADQLRARNRRQNEERLRDGKRELPESSRLLSAMDAGLPPSAGVALGFDRLMMVAVGEDSLAPVLAFPIERA